MNEQRPSKEQDYLAKLQDSHPMVQLQREVDRLQRQQTNLIAALGEAQAKIDELSIHAAKWVKRATTPAHEREMPHCSTCACPPYDAKALDEARRFKVGDEVPIAHWGETSKIVSIHCTLENGETIAVDCIAPEPAAVPVAQRQWIEGSDESNPGWWDYDEVDESTPLREGYTALYERAAQPPVDVRSVDCPACGKPMSEHKGDLKPGAVLWCP